MMLSVVERDLRPPVEIRIHELFRAVKVILTLLLITNFRVPGLFMSSVV
jgi:hypothetical protein